MSLFVQIYYSTVSISRSRHIWISVSDLDRDWMFTMGTLLTIFPRIRELVQSWHNRRVDPLLILSPERISCLFLREFPSYYVDC